ncbi:MAG: NF038143 family protein [Chlorobiales bacterium]|nr:NF038143 family protein [Chlorobiales bacterium]
MAPKPSPAVKAKSKIIQAAEKRWAFSVAVILKGKAKPITVWEVLLPVLFIFNYARARVDRDIFVDNLLFTKELALSAAREMVEHGRDKEAALESARRSTEDLLAKVEEEVYSARIRDEQLKEIELLADHYGRLLKAEGEDFETLVRNAYPSKDDYLEFLGRLKEIERAVGRAALETVGRKGDPAYVARMAEAIDRVRARALERIFPG